MRLEKLPVLLLRLDVEEENDLPPPLDRPWHRVDKASRKTIANRTVLIVILANSDRLLPMVFYAWGKEEII